MEEFKFPDEIENEAKSVDTDDNLEIEVVDDTPEKDRNRTPMKDQPADVTEEELNRYSDQKLKDRLAHLGKGIHETRRAKEAAEREKEEALRLAQSVIEENKKLKGSLAKGNEALLDQAKHTLKLDVENAKKQYKEAYEAGDSEALVAAQELLTDTKFKLDRVENFKPTLQDDENSVQIEPEVPYDAKAQAWKENNQWFGEDEEMTAVALALHQKLVKSGVNTRSDEYYKRIDARMKQVFPENFDSEDRVDESEKSRKSSSVVAPVTRSVAPKKITLTTTQVALAKKLGVPIELYAKKVAEEMRKQNG
jgi:hypothetical protein